MQATPHSIYVYRLPPHALFMLSFLAPSPIHRSSILKEDSNMKITQNVSINKCNSEEKETQTTKNFPLWLASFR